MDAMSCLAPPFLPTAASPAYYTDAAIARALHYSMTDNHQYSYSPAATSSSSPSSSSSLLADLPFCGGGANNWFADFAPAPPTTCDSVLVSSDAAPRPSVVTPVAGAAAAMNKRRLGLGPAAASAGRAGKRRPRASKRAPTTYISTDPANFRLMVQHVTGVQADTTGDNDGAVLQTMPASFDASSAAAAAGMLECPTFDGASAFGEPSNGDAAALHHRLLQQQQQQQQQQPCFPTLDSWTVMYENTELL